MIRFLRSERVFPIGWRRQTENVACARNERRHMSMTKMKCWLKIAGGVVQHHQDDYWFHTSPVFRDYEMKLGIEVREVCDSERGMRSGFVAHVMVEMFLDSYLQKKFPGQLERYYQIVADADPQQIQNTINQFATQPTTKLVPAIGIFLRERYIFDYLTDEGAVKRMNGVLRRLKLEALDERILPWAATARQRVYDHAEDLLSKYSLDLT